MTDYVLDKGKYQGPSLTTLGRAAVLVVDMTNDFAHQDGVYARHDATCESFPTIVAPVRSVLEEAHRAEIPTIAVSQVIYTGPTGRAVSAGGLLAGRPWLENEGLRPGTWGTRLIDDLPDTDFFIEKPRASAFIGTPVEFILRGLKTETVIIVGCYTNQCVESTARDAWARDFQVVVVVDGVTAFDPMLHGATLQSLRPLTTQLTSDQLTRLIASQGSDTGIKMDEC